MKKIKFFTILLSLLFAVFSFSPVLALCETSSVCLDDPLRLEAGQGPQQLIGRIIKGVLGLVGSLALAMFVYGGFTWMLAAGNSKIQYT